ncbi:MAG: NAD(P)/FAD-dependent oxidoreductase [Gammaproteobacteria bacterium]|nr:NAD(P)/FAD-dependent oxidoreductase [Gammaproteobacteria bacterium]
MRECDVLIVGGGPSGSTLAWSLRHSGLKVLVMDKESFPRDKVCAGWVTPAVMQSLQIDLNDYKNGRTLQEIKSFKTGTLGNNVIQTPYDQVVSYGIRRTEFDAYLLQRSGTETLQNTAFSTMQREGDYWIINNNIRTSLVIGAGGHFCPVARTLETRGKKQNIVAAQEVEFKLTEEQQALCHIDATEPELYFLPDLSGYAWAFRKGDYLNIGLGREDKNGLSKHVSSFVDYLKETGKIEFDIPERFKGHAYILQPHSLRTVVSDGIVLIGDAVGLAYPQSGEGIRPAIESAMMASTVIMQAQGRYTKENLLPYQVMLHQRYGKPMNQSRGWLPESWKQKIASWLMRQRWFNRNVVIERWFLHSQQPAMQAPDINNIA